MGIEPTPAARRTVHCNDRYHRGIVIRYRPTIQFEIYLKSENDIIVPELKGALANSDNNNGDQRERRMVEDTIYYNIIVSCR